MIHRATAYDLHGNTKEIIVTTYYTNENGEHLAEPHHMSLGKESALQYARAIIGFVNLHLKSDEPSKMKPLKPETTEQKEAE